MPGSDPLGGLRGWGQKVKIHFFSEHGHVAYQINGNHKCSSMVANIFAADLPPDTVGLFEMSNFNFFRTWSCAYQIKGYHKCSNMVANTLRTPPPPSPPQGGVKRSKFNFSRKKRELRKQQHSSKYSARRPPPPDPREWDQNSAFQNMVMLQIK